ncbi:WAS/WASL-interacting protein family member 1-like [Canis lupus dingo]|uniref:WAS/WASL-interacting protein family member 1-like n=1 Tax=Canis lupus dingo TaxID=286419 RepID=UPI0020C408C2|nr:WAS/WASL-interacting protein family member 1-like [Canis lupus dingo]
MGGGSGSRSAAPGTTAERGAERGGAQPAGEPQGPGGREVQGGPTSARPPRLDAFIRLSSAHVLCPPGRGQSLPGGDIPSDTGEVSVSQRCHGPRSFWAWRALPSPPLATAGWRGWRLLAEEGTQAAGGPALRSTSAVSKLNRFGQEASPRMSGKRNHGTRGHREAPGGPRCHHRHPGCTCGPCAPPTPGLALLRLGLRGWGGGEEGGGREPLGPHQPPRAPGDLQPDHPPVWCGSGSCCLQWARPPPPSRLQPAACCLAGAGLGGSQLLRGRLRPVPMSPSTRPQGYAPPAPTLRGGSPAWMPHTRQARPPGRSALLQGLRPQRPGRQASAEQGGGEGAAREPGTGAMSCSAPFLPGDEERESPQQLPRPAPALVLEPPSVILEPPSLILEPPPSS